MADDRRVVVIGSGPSGAMAAHTLVHAGIPVTMLESGSAVQRGLQVRIAGKSVYRHVPKLQNATDYLATGDPNTRWFRNFAPGGLSNQWTGAVPRFAPQDFTDGERLDARYRWPIRYGDIAAYYAAAERLMMIWASARDVPGLPAAEVMRQLELPTDWRKVAEVAAKHGQGLTMLPLAEGHGRSISLFGTGFNSYPCLVGPLLRRKNFELIKGAHALQVEWSPAKRRAIGVVYQSRHDGSRHRIETAAVVVTCGPLQSTKLLFDSACDDFPNGLGNSRGLLGKYLHDHPKEWWAFDADRPLTLLSPSAYLTRPPYYSTPPLTGNSWTLGVASTEDRVRSRFGGKGLAVGVQVFGMMTPTPDNYVRPSAECKDEFGMPGLEVCIRFDQNTACNMSHAREHLLTLMDEAGYRCISRSVEPQLTPGSAVHYGGTTRMHESPEFGVLDAWNRVYDAPNVLVCDAGCFTTGPEKNPTLTVMAIAARAADQLAADLAAK